MSNPTPTTAIKAAQEIERALEAGPSDGPWSLWGHATPSQAVASDSTLICQTTGGNDESNAKFIAAANPTNLRALLSRLKEMEAMTQWVSVDERLPVEKDGTVAVLFDDGQPGVGWATYWHGASSHFAQWNFPLDDLGEGREVVAWVPLPAPPCAGSAIDDGGVV